MPLKNYGVLKGKAIDVRNGAGSSPHYQVRIIDDTTDYRIAINVESKLAPSELEYAIVEHFTHPILPLLEACKRGFTNIATKPGTGALDYIRGNLFNRSLMKPLPATVPGLDNDLNDKIQRIMQRAMANEDAVVYAFGERWGPENGKKDQYFGFLPGNGIHDIHMNQSNVGEFVKDDGVWQDGGLLINFPGEKDWVALFLKFQSQNWHSDDKTGHKIIDGGDDRKGLVQIVAALVNSKQSPEVELVTIINTSPSSIDLRGWKILDTNKNKQALSGEIKGGEARVIRIEKPVELSNKGGIITIVDDKGLKVDGVSYTDKQASNPGWTIVF
jgi:uncharacterized protein YukJ